LLESGFPMKSLIAILWLAGVSLLSVPVNAQAPPDPTIAAAGTSAPVLHPPLVPAAGDPLFAPLATTDGPESFHEKLMYWAVNTVGPRSFVLPAVTAGIRMVDPPSAYPRAWKDGGGAFGRNYGNDFARHASAETGRFLTGAILHEDFRYRPSTSRNPLVRSFHALAFTFVDRSDSGHRQIALANFVGAGAGGFVGELYLPPGFNNRSHAETQVAIQFGTYAGRNLLREFEPELLKLAVKLHFPHTDFPVPVWWVKRY
jgi:hypothetical protein